MCGLLRLHRPVCHNATRSLTWRPSALGSLSDRARPVCRWFTVNDQFAPSNPCLFCDKCFRMLHYDAEGKKLGEFLAYPYVDRGAFNWPRYLFISVSYTCVLYLSERKHFVILRNIFENKTFPGTFSSWYNLKTVIVQRINATLTSPDHRLPSIQLSWWFTGALISITQADREPWVCWSWRGWNLVFYCHINWEKSKVFKVWIYFYIWPLCNTKHSAVVIPGFTQPSRFIKNPEFVLPEMGKIAFTSVWLVNWNQTWNFSSGILFFFLNFH